MNNVSFVRKVSYLVTMAIFLVPLYLISAPSFSREDGSRSEGGLLTQLRERYNLSQANLGEIDPASESMKLATLGMRGVAANILWERANEYKKKEQWDNLRATLNQIAKLQPNFILVWQHQAWNLSYNVSVEFDNYEQRYHWVKKGIDFLMEGIRYNRNEPRLLWDLGWFFGHKFGRSDEYKQFRTKYGTDDDFHNSFASKIDINEAKDFRGRPDNWLTAHQWFNKAQDAVDLDGVTIKGKNPLVFHSDSGKALIRYADAIEEEGTFDEVARIAWQKAESRWKKYGGRDIPTSYGYTIQLNDGEAILDRIKADEEKLDSIVPGLRQKLVEDEKAQMTPEELALLEMDLAGLQGDEYLAAKNARARIAMTPEDVVAALKDPKKKRDGLVISKRLNEATQRATTIRRYRDIVNFVYWRTRCEVEQQDRALEGRRYLYEANEAYKRLDPQGALAKYEEAWSRWSSIHQDYPILSDDVMAEDLVDAIKLYAELLGKLDEEFPSKDFPLLRLVANFADEFPELDENELERMADEYEARLAKEKEEASQEEASQEEAAPEEGTDAEDTAETADPASSVDDTKAVDEEQATPSDTDELDADPTEVESGSDTSNEASDPTEGSGGSQPETDAATSEPGA